MKIKYLAASILAISTSLSHAGAYISASVGQADVDLNGFDNSTSFSISGGYKFNKHFAVEGSYIDLGNSKDNIAPVWTLDADGFNFSIVGLVPVSENIELFAKAGAFMWDATLSEKGFGKIASDDGTDFSYGLGASITVSENFDLALQYQMFDIDDSDVSNIAIEAKYNF